MKGTSRFTGKIKMSSLTNDQNGIKANVCYKYSNHMAHGGLASIHFRLPMKMKYVEQIGFE